MRILGILFTENLEI